MSARKKGMARGWAWTLLSSSPKATDTFKCLRLLLSGLREDSERKKERKKGKGRKRQRALFHHHSTSSLIKWRDWKNLLSSDCRWPSLDSIIRLVVLQKAISSSLFFRIFSLYLSLSIYSLLLQREWIERSLKRTMMFLLRKPAEKLEGIKQWLSS